MPVVVDSLHMKYLFKKNSFTVGGGMVYDK